MEDGVSSPASPRAVYFAVIILLACQHNIIQMENQKPSPLMALMKRVFGRPRLDSGLA